MFYAWGEIRFIPVMLGLSVVDYWCGRKMDKYFDDKKKKRIFMLIDVITNLSVLFFFKYIDFFIGNANSLFGLSIPLLGVILPIGVSFNTFQSISYTIDVYRGTTTCEKSYYNYLTYTTLFPQIIAGPIVRYVTVEDDLDIHPITVDNLSLGIRRFLIGLGKKVLIANNVGLLWSQIQNGQITELSTVLYWVGIVAFAFQIYFDFSGYSDMAIGLAKIFGLTFDENFNYPYISRSITEFWRRWHMTLSAWFKDYVYIPLGGNRKGKVAHIRNLLIVWGLTGFWHGASWNFIFWGLYFAVILIIEKFVLFRFWEKIPKAIQHLYAILLILISWVIFSFDSVSAGWNFIKGMFGGNHVPFYNEQAGYVLITYGFTFLLAGFLCTPVFRKWLFKLENKKNKGIQITVSLFYLVMFLFCVAYLVNSTYNPFLYFRF
ncbi:MBOAT family O-acyltransferase [Paludicola sp. MB14-C6]|uniref:MBOAT family O-acyltransferase n=1 Tax=Paludihabitans sp. MB14-C6 TaxID=3070656 RepID=UPI0027DD1C0A|nr:MBOAT family O-acyltransferase [Paludicola sp. MB14-C6]WMJ22965.1 MBOAT family O-acyltransferase [Paludicola sp. MB14-C6]